MPCSCSPIPMRHRKSFASSSLTIYSDLISVGLRKGSRAAKSHKFQMFSWKAKILVGSKCNLCEQNVYLKTYRCSFCGLHGHRRCLKETVIECPTYFMIEDEDEPLFGQNLSSLREMVPMVVWKCVSEVERRSFKNLQYIYEADGPAEHVRRLVRSFNLAGDLVDLSEVHHATIGSLLKQYLLETSDPLLQMSSRSQYIDIANTYADKSMKEPRPRAVKLIYELLKLIYKLPPVSRYTLCYICHHLRQVAANSRFTSMSTSDLARIFAPLFFGTARRRRRNSGRSSSEASQMLDTMAEARIVEIFLEHTDTLFGPVPSLRCIAYFNGAMTSKRKQTM